MSAAQSYFEVLQRFAAAMVSSFEVNDVLYQLGDSTVAVLEASGAGVSVVDDDGRLLFVTATSEAVVGIEQAQEAHQAGPCVEAFTTGDVIAVANIADLDRWPEYQAAAATAGFQAVVGLPLAVGDQRVGSLNVYDVRTRTWSEDDLRACRVLADIATAYIVRAGELAEVRRLSEQLQQALDSRVVIEQAKGMLARDHGVSVDDAFSLLRSHARSKNESLRAVATSVVEDHLKLG